MEHVRETLPSREVIETLLHKDHYTVDEAAYLLGVNSNVVQQAAHRHELKSSLADHHVICIHRDDLLEWLDTR